MTRSTTCQLLSICLGACAVGCHSKSDLPAETAAAVEPPVVMTPATLVTDSRQSSAPEPELAESGLAAPAVAEFTPPFPDRLELFEPPKRAQSNVRRDDEHGETVELKGFINVDQPRVVLSIDGQISPVAEGGEKYGVKVISIQPPSVVLQRGRNRWTATLE